MSSVDLCRLLVRLLFICLVIVRIIDPLHEHLAVVYLLGERRLDERLDIPPVIDAFLHRVKVILLVDEAPIDAEL